MGGVQVGELRRKRVVRKMDGSIIDWSDDTDGSGPIVIKGQVINQKKIDHEVQKEKDKELAAKAESLQVNNVIPEVAEIRNSNPSEMKKLEARVDGMENTLKEILKAVTKK